MFELKVNSVYLVKRGNFAVWNKPINGEHYGLTVGRLVKGDHFMVVDVEEDCYHILSNKTSCWLYSESFCLTIDHYLQEL